MKIILAILSFKKIEKFSVFVLSLKRDSNNIVECDFILALGKKFLMVSFS
jgi:hypothetical protein